jgi:hypothetical protein
MSSVSPFNLPTPLSSYVNDRHAPPPTVVTVDDLDHDGRPEGARVSVVEGEREFEVTVLTELSSLRWGALETTVEVTEHGQVIGRYSPDALGRLAASDASNACLQPPSPPLRTGADGSQQLALPGIGLLTLQVLPGEPAQLHASRSFKVEFDNEAGNHHFDLSTLGPKDVMANEHRGDVQTSMTFLPEPTKGVGRMNEGPQRVWSRDTTIETKDANGDGHPESMTLGFQIDGRAMKLRALASPATNVLGAGGTLTLVDVSEPTRPRELVEAVVSDTEQVLVSPETPDHQIFFGNYSARVGGSCSQLPCGGEWYFGFQNGEYFLSAGAESNSDGNTVRALESHRDMNPHVRTDKPRNLSGTTEIRLQPAGSLSTELMTGGSPK